MNEFRNSRSRGIMFSRTYLWLIPAIVLISSTLAVGAQDANNGLAIRPSKDNVSETPLKEALPTLRKRIASHFSRNESAKADALRLLANYEGVEELIASEIASDVAGGKFSERFQDNFIVLAKLRTPKALAIIGPYLYDERVMQAPSEDTAHDIPSGNAAMALTTMNLTNAPTSAPGWNGVSRQEIETWKIWWEANKNDLEKALYPEQNAPPPSTLQTGENELSRSPERESVKQGPQTPLKEGANSHLNLIILLLLGGISAAVASWLLLGRSRR